MVRGETGKLSRFGNFSARSRSERVGRNPKTGIEATIEKRQVMVFKASNQLNAHMNGEAAEDND